MNALLDKLGVNHGAFGAPWFTLSVVAALALVHVLFGAAPDALLYDRAAIADGQLWRLITGHVVHVDGGHLAWNVGAFFIMGTILETRLNLSPRCHLGVLLSGVVAVSLWLWFGQSDLARYAGLSAVLNAQFIVLAAVMWRETQNPLALVAGLGGIAKTVVELGWQTALLTAPPWPPVPEAHAAGLLAGAAWVWVKRQNLDRQPMRATFNGQML